VSIQDLTDFTDQVSIELGSLASKVSVDAFEAASNKVYNEVQWAYPISDPFKVFWALERGKRHLIQIFLIESAHKFKYKQIHLNQRFDHYLLLIKKMDEDFLLAIEENPEAFPTPAGGVPFPAYIANTFTYDFLGRSLGT
jgi:hypothetical protein